MSALGGSQSFMRVFDAQFSMVGLSIERIGDSASLGIVRSTTTSCYKVAYRDSDSACGIMFGNIINQFVIRSRQRSS